MPDLLLEYFSEEIPARMQPRARDDLARRVGASLEGAGLAWSGMRALSTPRRLVLIVEGLPWETPATREERKGPRADAPDKAIEGFLRSTGLSREQLEVRETKKGDVLFAVIDRPGQPVAEAIAAFLPEQTRTFPWPKSMRWGAGSLRWVRPLQSILCALFEEGRAPEPVSFEIDGIASGLITRGHRVHGPMAFTPASVADYEAKLARAGVTLDQGERRAAIEAQMAALAAEAGLEALPDAALLDEVTGLVEHPVAILGAIDAAFHDLPPEVLQTSMREHQKFFSLRDPAREQITHFITIANITAPDGGATIRAGNERVLRARLSDAKFFWDNDLRKSLEAMAEPLSRVVFHAKLGTQAERIERIAALAREVAPAVGASPDIAERAARFAKADLASEMVYEFPELQGVMGRYYALMAGESMHVADAARDHYKPLGPTDEVPTDPVAVAVALADKIDMLTGFWAIDEKPTGSKDPFALRRAALGVIRIVLENGVRTSLLKNFVKPVGDALFRQIELNDYQADWLLEKHDPHKINEIRSKIKKAKEEASGEGYGYLLSRRSPSVEAEAKQRAENLLTFLADRLKVALREKGTRHDVIDAVFALGGQDDLVALVARVEAVQRVLETTEGADLLAGYKRAANILAREEGAAEAVDAAALVQPEETALHAALTAAEPVVGAALEREAFAEAMAAVAALRAPLDAFFNEVTVNADDPALRANRLALLIRARDLMRRIADFERIAASGRIEG